MSDVLTEAPETGWLLDDGEHCLGQGGCTFLVLVPYNSIGAIRFARKQDAQTMREVLIGMGRIGLANSVRVVEHQWIGPNHISSVK